MEEAVYRISNLRADAENCREEIRSRAEICLLAKEFDAVALGLKRIIRSRSAFDLYLGRFKLEWLLCAGSERENAGYDKRSADIL